MSTAQQWVNAIAREERDRRQRQEFEAGEQQIIADERRRRHLKTEREQLARMLWRAWYETQKAKS